MYRNRRRSRIGRVAVAGAAALFAVGVAACSSSASSSSSSSSSTITSTSPTASSTAAVQPGGDATVALPAGVSLNYIWPFVPITSANVYNTLGFQELLYRPLYYFGGNNSSIAVNYDLSTADAPVYTNGGKTVTITMKGWKWSNGETVDANDVVFFLNLLEAEKANYYGYVPGLLPDNLVSYKATGPDTLVLNLKSAVSSVWFTYNQLAEVTPFPEAWDVTSATGASGSGGCLTDSATDKWAKCTAVYTFLSKQATNTGTYASSPIWGVVDGPWKLTAFSSGAGDDTFVPNMDYSGSPKPVLSQVTYKYFTDDSTEYTALKTGSLDVGYIPSQDLPQKPATQLLPTTNPLQGTYNLSPAYQDGIFYFQPNFNNPTVGPIFKQLYIRQALQEVIDQNGIDTAVYRGYGYPTAGPVPTQPKSQWVPSIEYSNNGQGPYAFSVSAATALLTSHGWTNQGGTDVCTKPGTGAGECGAGIASGTKLNLTMDYPTGIEAYTQEVQVFKSDAQQAGINIDTIAETFTTIEGQDVACSGAKCTWELDAAGGWLFNGPGFEPTGEPLFATGASANIGSYSNPTEDNLINETHTSSSMTVFDQYATYTAQQLPFLWTPNAYAVQAVASNLANVNFNPLDDFLPEYWNFTK
jgi:peptide/nickel transport system substrate-binding protein